MSRQGYVRRAAGWIARLAPTLAVAIAAGLGSDLARAQPAPATATPPVAPADNVPFTPGAESAPPPSGPVLPVEIQVVRFQGPEGVSVEILGPSPETVPVGDGRGLLTVGMKVGTPYRLRLTNLPDRPGAEVFPVIEIVGHLHRPPGVDPGKYPIRVVFSNLDFEDVVDRGRLVTQVIYLEDPEQALPITLPKDQIPVVDLNPSEEPLRVGAALGRVVALVRMGARHPTPDDTTFGAYGVVGPGVGSPCPFTQAAGERCNVPCGPVCGTPPPAGRPWLPKDEYLCDGGDHGDPARFAGVGGLSGIDPRDAVVSFDDGRRTRALPTNMVCVYAPRFAEVRTSVGPNQALTVAHAANSKLVQKETTEAAKQGPKRMTQNLAAEAALHRARASAVGSRTRAGTHGDVRGVAGYELATRLALKTDVKRIGQETLHQQPAAMRERQRFEGIKTAESAVITGITEGASQTVMTWTPRETVGVELPPDKPGLAVIKRVSAGEAEAGDVLTFVIQYRNMGNTPIREVTVVDSLLPRLGYVKGSARGPQGTVFTADDNRAGSTELKWVLPGPLKPGVEGHVSFQSVVR